MLFAMRFLRNCDDDDYNEEAEDSAQRNTQLLFAANQQTSSTIVSLSHNPMPLPFSLISSHLISAGDVFFAANASYVRLVQESSGGDLFDAVFVGLDIYEHAKAFIATN